MNEIMNVIADDWERAQQTMTTKELAEALGVSNMAIMRVLEKTNNLNGTVKVENGKAIKFTEEQATMIKLELQKHHNLATRQIDDVSTEVEENLLIEQAISILKRRVADAEKEVEKLRPAAEFAYQICSSKDAIDIGNCAKVLNRNIGRNRLFEFLRNKNILQPDNIPYQKYIDSGYFRVIETKFTIPSGETKISLKTLVLQKGVAYINKLLKEAGA